MRRFHHHALAAAALAALAFLARPADAANVEVDTVARSGQAAPGFATPFSGFWTSPAISPTGTVVFNGQVSGAGDNVGIFAGTPGGLSLVARHGGDAALGGPTFTNLVQYASVDSSGRVSFFGTVNSGNTANDTGLWTWSGGTLTNRAREGSPAPGTTGTFSSFEAVDVYDLRPNSNAGRTALNHGTSAGRGLWTTPPGGDFSLVAKQGDTAPGLPAGGQFGSNFFSPSINNSGAVAFKASVQGVNLPGAFDAGLWTASPTGALTKIARSGDVVPGGPAGSQFEDVGFRPGFNNAGKVAFLGFLIADPSQNRGLWAHTAAGGLTKIALEGEPAPGAGANWLNFGAPVVTSSGDVAFLGRVSAPAPNTGGDVSGDGIVDGIWKAVPGAAPALVMNEGTQAPGMPAGVVFRGAPQDFNVNSSGLITFLTSLTGGDTQPGDQALYAWDPASGLRLLAASGDTLRDGNTTLGTINFFGFSAGSGGEDGRPSSLAEDGTVTFYASYSGGSGIFTITVPEPSVLGSLTFAAGLLVLRRRRRSFN